MKRPTKAARPLAGKGRKLVDMAAFNPDARRVRTHISVNVPPFVFQEVGLTRSRMARNALEFMTSVKNNPPPSHLGPESKGLFHLGSLLINMSYWLTLNRKFHSSPVGTPHWVRCLPADLLARAEIRFGDDFPVSTFVRGAMYYLYWVEKGYARLDRIPPRWRIARKPVTRKLSGEWATRSTRRLVIPFYEGIK